MITDTTQRYKAPYWEPIQKKVVEFAPMSRDYLIKPIQML